MSCRRRAPWREDPWTTSTAQNHTSFSRGAHDFAPQHSRKRTTFPRMASKTLTARCMSAVSKESRPSTPASYSLIASKGARKHTSTLHHSHWHSLLGHLNGLLVVVHDVVQEDGVVEAGGEAKVMRWFQPKVISGQQCLCVTICRLQGCDSSKRRAATANALHSP